MTTNWSLTILLETIFIVIAAKGKVTVLARIALSCSKVIINSSLFFEFSSENYLQKGF